MPRAVVFDLDGVLIDSELANIDSARETCKVENIQLDAEDLRRIVGRHPVAYLPEICQRYGLGESAFETMLTRQYKIYDTLAPGVELNPGARDVLTWLSSRGVRIALATASDLSYVTECLERYGVLGQFEFLLTRESVDCLKPDPEVYLKALDQLALPAREAMVIEDSGHGVQAALGAGIPCIAVRTRWVRPEAIAAAQAQIDSLAELPGLFSAREQ